MVVDLSDKTFIQGTRLRWTTQLRDENDAPIPAASITSLQLTVASAYDETAIVVDGVDVLNTGRGTMDSSGNVVVSFLAEDMVKVTSLGVEKILARLDWVYSGTPGSWSIYIGLTD